MSSLELENVNLTIGNHRILNNISLTIPIQGEMIGVMGPNGSGKSSLIKSIIGELPFKGRILLNQTHSQNALKQITYIPQKSELDLNFPINVENVVLSGCYQNLGWFKRVPSSLKSQCVQTLKQLGLDHLRKRQLNALSGGQLQRVLIARALMSDSLVYLLDEPFVGIDFKSEAIIFEQLKQLKAQGKLIIVVHHDLSSAQHYFDRIILLNQSVQFFGDSETALRPEMIESTFLKTPHETNRVSNRGGAIHDVHSTSI